MCPNLSSFFSRSVFLLLSVFINSLLWDIILIHQNCVGSQKAKILIKYVNCQASHWSWDLSKEETSFCGSSASKIFYWIISDNTPWSYFQGHITVERLEQARAWNLALTELSKKIISSYLSSWSGSPRLSQSSRLNQVELSKLIN